MFDSPQSAVIGASTLSLPRVSTQGYQSEYRSASGELRVNIVHSEGKRRRSNVRFDHQKLSADPLNSSVNRQYTSRVSMSIDTPPAGGYTTAELEDLLEGFTTYVGSQVFRDKFLGFES